jgi:Resolvase, N terminal domain
MLDYARARDTVVVTAIDRLGRSVAEVTRTIAELGERRILLRALREGIDTATPTGRAVAAIMATLAELELELGRERRAAARVSRRARRLPAKAWPSASTSPALPPMTRSAISQKSWRKSVAGKRVIRVGSRSISNQCHISPAIHTVHLGQIQTVERRARMSRNRPYSRPELISLVCLSKRDTPFERDTGGGRFVGGNRR